MSSRRTLILVGAIVVGAIAALLILRYVGSVEDKASSDGQLVQVVVAAGDIQKGETADVAIGDGRIELGKRRRVDLPANAVTRLEDIMSQSAVIDLAAGEVITTTKFAGADSTGSTTTDALTPGNVALTVSFDAARGVAGLVSPGDYVNLVTDSTGDTRPAGTYTVFQKVKVLAVGTNLGTQVAAPTEGDVTATTAPAAPSDLVTFDVPPEAAQVISSVASASMRMVLVRPDYQPRPIPPYSPSPVIPLPGQDGRTPYEGQPATAAPTAGASR